MDDNEAALEEHRAHLRVTRDAYLKVFGPPGARTPMGSVILKDLERFARYRDTAVTRDRNGRFDGGATAYNTGLQDVLKRIHLKIEWRESDGYSSSLDPERDGDPDDSTSEPEHPAE